MERVLILNEHAIHLTLSVNFDGQFEDGLSVLDSLCTLRKNRRRGICGEVDDCAQASLRRIIHF